MTQRTLHISPDLTLPKDFVTQTCAILAKRRVGKTYTASVIAEEMVAAGLPFVVLDPTGAWWGLRAAADGKSEGLPVVIIGGAHGDVALEPTAGKVIADLVVDHPGHYIIDLSMTESDAQQDRFAEDFAVRLYRRKQSQRDPLHLFVDEADSFMPQRPFPNQTKMLGAFEACNRRGGLYGIGMTVITQRPAVLNKNVLSQSEMLIILQVTAPQDQDAIDDWIKRNGTKEQRDTIMASMSSLKTGEAWIWSPTWLEVFKQVHIRERHTFNSSATPKAGERAITPAKLAPVDLAKLGAEIEATIERAKADDPKELKRQLADLKKQLAARPAQAPAAAPIVERVEVPVVTEEQWGRLEKAVSHLTSLDKSLTAASMELSRAIRDAHTDLSGALASRLIDQRRSLTPAERAHAQGLEPLAQRYRERVVPATAQPVRTKVGAAAAPGTLTGGELKIMAFVAQHPEGVTRAQLTVAAGYKRSSRDTYLQRLSSRGLIFMQGGSIVATAEGIEALGPDYEPLPTGSALQDYWLNRLSGGDQAILKVAIAAYPEAIDRDAVSEQTSYKRSSRDTFIQHLKARGLITAERGGIRASDMLFD